MKNINFIYAMKPADQKKLRSWWFVSCVVSGILLCVMIGLHGIQLYHWYTLSTERAQLQTTLNGLQSQIHTVQTLRQEQQSLQRNKNKCERVRNSLFCIEQMLSSLEKIQHQITVRSCSQAKTGIEFIVEADCARVVTNALPTVQTIPGCSNVQLISLASGSDKRIIATLSTKREKSLAPKNAQKL